MTSGVADRGCTVDVELRVRVAARRHARSRISLSSRQYVSIPGGGLGRILGTAASREATVDKERIARHRMHDCFVVHV